MRSHLLLALACTASVLLSLKCVDAKIVRHIFVVKYLSGSPDGVYKEKILGINGKFPGPTIFADAGDTLEIDVINHIQDGQNTSIHWHGIHQKGSLFEDGATLVTQCPLGNGDRQRYTFVVREPGTYWYHSHVKSQYTEGLWGALIVYNTPEAYPYDEEIILTLNDWNHRTAIENEHWHLSPPALGVPPYPDTGMINGLGRYPCDYAVLQNRTCNPAIQHRPVIHVHRNKVYRVRVINTGAVAAFNFSIDGHLLRTIEVDGLDVATPFFADVAPIAPAQRYSFLINTGGSGSDFLVRANLRVESLMLIEGGNINEYPEALMANVTAVLRYVDDSLPAPHYTSEPHSYMDVVPESTVLNPVYLDENKLGPRDGIPAPSNVDQRLVLNVGFYEDHENITRGSFNHTPFVFPDSKPMLMSLLDGEEIPSHIYTIDIDYMNVVEIVMNNLFFGPHPFHLHGHHFWVLGTGAWDEGDFDPARHNQSLTLTGAKRDTVVIQSHSWAVIRFIADNPGIWTFHCHNDWHNLAGMSVAFIEGRDILRRDTTVTEEASRVCRNHRN